MKLHSTASGGTITRPPRSQALWAAALTVACADVQTTEATLPEVAWVDRPELPDAPVAVPTYGPAVWLTTFAGELSVVDPAGSALVQATLPGGADVFDTIPLDHGHVAALLRTTQGVADIADDDTDDEGAIQIAGLLDDAVVAETPLPWVHHALGALSVDAGWRLVAVTWSDRVDPDGRRYDDLVRVDVDADGAATVERACTADIFPPADQTLESDLEVHHTNGVHCVDRGPLSDGPVCAWTTLRTGQLLLVDPLTWELQWSAPEATDLVGPHGPFIAEDGVVWVLNNQASRGTPGDYSEVVAVDPRTDAITARFEVPYVPIMGGVSVAPAGALADEPVVLVTLAADAAVCAYTRAGASVTAFGDGGCVSVPAPREVFRADFTP